MHAIGVLEWEEKIGSRKKAWEEKQVKKHRGTNTINKIVNQNLTTSISIVNIKRI